MKLIIFFICLICIIYFSCGKSFEERYPLKHLSAKVQDFKSSLSSESGIKTWISATAKDLNNTYKKTSGEVGLDNIRYNRFYEKEIIPDDRIFDWQSYRKRHPEDAVLFDETGDRKFHIFTNYVDLEIFEFLLYVNKQ